MSSRHVQEESGILTVEDVCDTCSTNVHGGPFQRKCDYHKRLLWSCGQQGRPSCSGCGEDLVRLLGKIDQEVMKTFFGEWTDFLTCLGKIGGKRTRVENWRPQFSGCLCVLFLRMRFVYLVDRALS